MTWRRFLEEMRDDLRYVWRSIARAPGFTILSVITLALGIGVNTTTFAVVDQLFLRPPDGVKDPERVRRIWLEHVNPGSPAGVFAEQVMTYPAYRAMSEALRGRASLSAVIREDALRIGPSGGARVAGVYASSSYFDVLRVRPALGRVYSAAEDMLGAAQPVIVVSDAFWRTHLGADSSALGQVIAVDGKPFVVIGVLRREFRGADLTPVDLWMPIGHYAVSMPRGGPWWESLNVYPVRAIARLSDTTVEEEVQRAATRHVRVLQRSRGRRDTLLTVLTSPIIETRGPSEHAQKFAILKRLSVVAAIVLLIACINVTHLLVARAVARRRDVAVRMALGISRWRLARLLTTEVLVLAGLAGIVALLASWWGARFLRSLVMPDFAGGTAILHVRVVAVTAVAVLLASVMSSVVPAAQAGSLRLASALSYLAHDYRRRRSVVQNGLVIGQTALSTALLIVAALFLRSLENVRALRTGFDVDRLVFGTVAFEAGGRPRTPALAYRMRHLVASLDAQPGIVGVARAEIQPMGGYGRRRFWIRADSAESLGPRAPKFHHVSPSFFRTTGMRLLKGAGFIGGDTRGAPPEAVVNEAAARLLWPDQDPLGQCIRLDGADRPCRSVVGVAENARVFDVVESERFAQIYLPLGDTLSAERAGSTIILRTATGGRNAGIARLQSALRGAFPTAETRVTSMSDFLAPQYRPWRLGAILSIVLGGLALTLALMGVFSTAWFHVSQRTHEFGVRLAVGARRSDVLRQVLRERVQITLIGVIGGILMALAASRLVTALLYGITPNDPLVLLFAASALVVAAVLAVAVPAWRAASLNPASTLRSQ